MDCWIVVNVAYIDQHSNAHAPNLWPQLLIP